jgi:hypothetical protein
MKIAGTGASPGEKEGRTGRGSLYSRNGGLLAVSPFRPGGMRAFRCLANPYQKIKRTRL